MKLYSFIQNEQKVRKRQGGQKFLKIVLLHEVEAKNWKDATEELDIFLNWNEGKPTLKIVLPKNWRIDGTNIAEMVNEKELDPKLIECYYEKEELKTPSITCINCHRGAYERYDGDIICANCGEEERNCKCEPVKEK